MRAWHRRIFRVYTRGLWTDSPGHRLEVDNLRGLCWPYEGHKTRGLHSGGAEFSQVYILFAHGKLNLLKDFAGYASELLGA